MKLHPHGYTLAAQRSWHGAGHVRVTTAMTTTTSPQPPIQISDDKIIDTLECVRVKSLIHGHFKCVSSNYSYHCGSIEDSGWNDVNHPDN